MEGAIGVARLGWLDWGRDISQGSKKTPQEDIAYLRSVLPSTTEEAFFEYLCTVDASEVTVSSVPEGSVVFSRVSMGQGPAPAGEGAAAGGAAAGDHLAVPGQLCQPGVHERRPLPASCWSSHKADGAGAASRPGPDGGLSASKYSYIGGFDCTSNVLAGKLYGIPVQGTVAHSFIMSFTSLAEVEPRVLVPAAGGEPVDLPSLAESWLPRVCELLQVSPSKVNRGELAAFVSYAVSFPRNFQGLLDTYCVMRSGLPNFCAVALALNELGYRAIGVRLDSGDLAQQSKEIRQAFRACSAHFQVPWFETISIAVSNDISERSLEDFIREGNDIDVLGIGTNLVTCPLQPSLGCVYKLVKVNDSPCLKLTEDEDKMTIPGVKRVYRLYDAAGHPFMDLMALEEEPSPSAGQELTVHVLGQNGEARKVKAATVEALHRTYFKDGQVRPALPSPGGLRVRLPVPARPALGRLSPAHRRLRQPEPYPVAITEKLHGLFGELRRAS
ncbi:PREDICTED: LOW QUALITY PROTEIN: nicotinate phosphoribosyltransferase [Tinamus guttatus]|uniref:LOW QUALITY PROTEIN: nicotinate phosphoribosyltransferase n=1 Tax=Tinamus guttatus TaxID=94827 RepID=UPI00052EAAEB|nr:PREDICTED: LOW QUALITY PROTEIN: nicotinate phosphoribosyltransferase [Tinamus guttatus]